MSAAADRLAAYRRCEEKILGGGQQVRAPDGRTVTMADLEQVRDQIAKLENQVAAERRRGGIGVSLSTFGDAGERGSFRRGGR